MGDTSAPVDLPTIRIATLTPEQQDRRRRIIDAAFELGAEKGYDAVQMRDVAAISNVSLATIYRYFSSKDHLLAAAMTGWMAKLQSRVAQSPPRGDDAVEQLIDVLRRGCRAMERQPKLTRALVRAMGASASQIQRVFLWQGAVVGVVGSIAGTAIGYGLLGVFKLAPLNFTIETPPSLG